VLINPSMTGDTGLLDLGLEIEIIEVATGDDIVGRTGLGINPLAIGDTVTLYVFPADIPATQAWAAVWWLGSDILQADIGAPPPSSVFVPIVQPIPGTSVPPGTWYYKRGDDRMPLVGQFIWNGLAQDISTAAVLLFKARLAGPSGPDFTQPLQINSPQVSQIPPPDPTVIDDGSWFSFQPTETDMSIIGQYDCEVEGTWPDGSVLTSPTTSDLAHEYFQLIIEEDTDGS
jgi:hypothetical protein